MASLPQNAVKFKAKLPEVTKETSMLQGKTALITNATSVIGLGSARALAQDGANIDSKRK